MPPLVDDYIMAISQSVREEDSEIFIDRSNDTKNAWQFDQWSADWITNAARFSSQAYDQACIQSETLSELNSIIREVDSTRDMTALPPKWHMDETIVHAQKKLESMSVGLKIWKQTRYKLQRQVELEEYMYTNNTEPLARVGLRNQLKIAKTALARHEASNEVYIRLGDVDQYISNIMKQSSDYDDRTESFLEKLAECGCLRNTNMELVLDNEHVQSAVGLIKYTERLMKTILNLIVKQLNERRQALRMSVVPQMLVESQVVSLQPLGRSVPEGRAYTDLTPRLRSKPERMTDDGKPSIGLILEDQQKCFQRYQTMREQANAEQTEKTTDHEKTTEVRLTRLVNHLSIMVHTIPFVAKCINSYLNDYLNRAYFEVQRTATAVETTALVKQAVDASIENTNHNINRAIRQNPVTGNRTYGSGITTVPKTTTVTDLAITTQNTQSGLASWWLGSTLSSLLTPPPINPSHLISPVTNIPVHTIPTSSIVTAVAVPTGSVSTREPDIGEIDPTIDYVYMLWYDGYPDRTYIPYSNTTPTDQVTQSMADDG